MNHLNMKSHLTRDTVDGVYSTLDTSLWFRVRRFIFACVYTQKFAYSRVS